MTEKKITIENVPNEVYNQIYEECKFNMRDEIKNCNFPSSVKAEMRQMVKRA